VCVYVSDLDRPIADRHLPTSFTLIKYQASKVTKQSKFQSHKWLNKRKNGSTLPHLFLSSFTDKLQDDLQ